MSDGVSISTKHVSKYYGGFKYTFLFRQFFFTSFESSDNITHYFEYENCTLEHIFVDYIKMLSDQTKMISLGKWQNYPQGVIIFYKQENECNNCQVLSDGKSK